MFSPPLAPGAASWVTVIVSSLLPIEATFLEAALVAKLAFELSAVEIANASFLRELNAPPLPVDAHIPILLADKAVPRKSQPRLLSNTKFTPAEDVVGLS